MKLSTEIKKYVDSSILCWVATVSSDGMPNVSPKEIFNYYGINKIIVANIASPQTVENILRNEHVCISFIDVLVQKGFQLKGKAKIIDNTNLEYSEMKNVLLEMTAGKFPFKSIIAIHIEHAKPIIAPKYILYPETTEEQQIEEAKRVYKL